MQMLVDVVEKPGDAKLSDRIRELEKDFVDAREQLEQERKQYNEDIQALQRQRDSLDDVKGRLEIRVTTLVKENAGKLLKNLIMKLVSLKQVIYWIICICRIEEENQWRKR